MHGPTYVKHYFYLRGPHVLSDCPSLKNNTEGEDDMEHLWHSTDRAKLKCWGGGGLSWYYKFLAECPGIEAGASKES